MKTSVHIFTIILLLCNCLAAPAQPVIHFKNLTTKDGLAGDVVYALHQDKQGFLWIGTHRGLNRYDGYNFRLYAYDPSDTNSISGNHVHCIKEDGAGILWLSTNKGLNSLDPVTGKIKRYTLPDANMPEFMVDIFWVNDSILLINANSVFYRFNKRKAVFTAIKLLPHPYPYHGENAKFAKDKKGNIYIAGGRADGFLRTGALIIDWQNAVASHIPGDMWNVSPSRYGSSLLYVDSENNGWCFSHGKGLVSKEISGRKIYYPYTTPDPFGQETVFRAFFEEPGERLWIATGFGLVLYDYNTNRFHRYLHSPGDNLSIANNQLATIIKDRNGVYWVGTFGSGLCYFIDQRQFKHIIIDTSFAAGERKVLGMKTLHSGRIRVNTFAQKKFILEKDKTIHPENPARDFNEYISLDSLVLELTSKSMRSFSKKDSSLLHFFFEADCNRDSTKHYVKFEKMHLELGGGAGISLIISDYNNKVWIKYASIRLDDIDDHSLEPLKYQDIFSLPMADNNFLFATKKGLFIYDTKTNDIKSRFLPEPGNPYSISSSYVQYLLPDKKGNYWIATADAGFDYWDRKTNRFYNYSVKDGLPDNTVYMMLPDKHGRLWVSTNKGLSCFDTGTKTFTNYDEYDGLINTEFNSGSACTDNEGFMYFGGMNGIDYFHPDSLVKIKTPPALYVSTFNVHNQFQPLYASYALETQDDNIAIEFTSNDFLSTAKTFYRYKLQGIDDDWITLHGVNRSAYNKLPPGSYHFTVQASYDNKLWSRPLELAFSIAVPWFQSWWFFALLALFIIIAIYLLFRYRLQQQLKLFQVRNRISRDLHDDVGATLSSVRAYSEILKDNPDNPLIAELINDNAAEMIERLEVIAWATNPNHDSFESLYNRIQRYAAPLCLAKNIAFEFVTDGIAKEAEVPGEIRQNIFLVSKEAVNNSIKYAAADKIMINAFIYSGKFIMHISDNGKGFDTTTNDGGNGLKNMQSRIKDIGGTCNISSEQGKGTEIKIQLPYPFKIPSVKAGNGSR